MDEDRAARGTTRRVDLVLARAGHAHHDRVDRLEVARVGGELDRDARPARRLVLAARAEVVLHVAGALHRRRVDVALELLEDLVVALADHVGEHVEPAAVGHADARSVEARVGGQREDLSRIGIALSAPSRPNRFVPTYFVARNFSNASAEFSRSRIRRFSGLRQLELRALEVALDPPLLGRRPGCACTRRRSCGSTRRAARRAARRASSAPCRRRRR